MKPQVMIFDKPFVEDNDVIGEWEYIDLVKSEDDFSIDNIKNKEFIRGHKVIYFMPGGQPYWIYDGWTKGFLYTHAGGDEPVICNRYVLREINNDLFMFLEYFEDTEDGIPEINVLKKVSSKIFTSRDIGRYDDVNLPFVPDKDVTGKWKTISFVSKIGDFDPESGYDSKLYMKSIIFNADGTTKRIYDDDEWVDKWTKGKLIDTSRETVASYERKIINSKEYLFIEWKMGNYQFGGRDPEYYVLIKEAD